MDYRSWWSCLLIFVCKRLAWSTCTLRTRRFGWTNMTLSGGTTCTAFLRFSTSSNCTVFSFCKCMNVHKCKHAFLLCSIANGTSGTVSLPLPFFLGVGVSTFLALRSWPHLQTFFAIPHFFPQFLHVFLQRDDMANNTTRAASLRSKSGHSNENYYHPGYNCT